MKIKNNVLTIIGKWRSLINIKTGIATTRPISSYIFNTVILAYLIHTLQAPLIFSVFYSEFSIATFHLEYSTLQGTSETH